MQLGGLSLTGARPCNSVTVRCPKPGHPYGASATEIKSREERKAVPIWRRARLFSARSYLRVRPLLPRSALALVSGLAFQQLVLADRDDLPQRGVEPLEGVRFRRRSAFHGSESTSHGCPRRARYSQRTLRPAMAIIPRATAICASTAMILLFIGSTRIE